MKIGICLLNVFHTYQKTNSYLNDTVLIRLGTFFNSITNIKLFNLDSDGVPSGGHNVVFLVRVVAVMGHPLLADSGIVGVIAVAACTCSNLGDHEVGVLIDPELKIENYNMKKVLTHL